VTTSTETWDATLAPVDPTTLEPLGELEPTAADALDELVAVARAAMPAWSADPRRRARVLADWADALRTETDALVDALIAETGKPRGEAHAEVTGAAAALDYNAGLTRHLSGHAGTLPDGSVSHLVREPVGVTALIAPWNWPALLLLRDLAPALAAGVTAVVKPAPQTTHITAQVLEIGWRAGVPEGVVALARGDGWVADHLIRHPDVRAVAFTGSTRTGAAIMNAASTTMTRPLLELGGKNPGLVFADADLATAIPNLARGALITAGQMCMACSRLLVARDVLDEARALVVETFDAVRLGDPRDAATEMGPLISPAHAAGVRAAVDRARASAEVTGGGRVDAGVAGHVLAPALVEGPDLDAEVVQHDLFGPVLTLEPFDGEADAVRRANATTYGLVAAVWTSDVTRAWRTSAAVEAGTVWVNGWNSSFPEVPSGGVKSSGLGRTRGIHGLHQFTELKHVHFPAPGPG